MSTTPLARLGVVALAATAALWSLAPFASWWAETPIRYFAVAWDTWRWGGLAALLLVALALVLTSGRIAAAAAAAWRRLEAVPARRFVATASLLAGAATACASVALFSGNPRNVDGFAQLFQARIFLGGRLWAVPPAPAELPHFATLQMILGPERWYAQYPPGQSLVLAAGLALGAWWVLNPVIAAGFVAAAYRVAHWVAGETEARLATLLLLLSPFVVAIAGSEMSHLGAATSGLAAAACATATSGRRGALAAAGSGALLGLMAAFRPLDAVAAAVPVAAILLLASARPVLSLALATVAGAAASLPTLSYNAATTGHWLTFGYSALWGPDHALGFHDVPWGIPLTWRRAVALTGLDLHQLNVYLLDATVPVLAVAALGLAVGRRRLGVRDLVPALGAAGLFALLFFYWHRDVFYGPRLHFSAIPWVVILVARGAVLLSRIERPRLFDAPAGRATGLLLAGTLLLGLVALTPARLRAYRETTPIFSLHPDRDAVRAGIGHAVVVIPDGWGTRLITRMWAAGIPVYRSTRLYAAVDACTLEQALGAAETDPDARARLVETLDSLAGLARPGIRGAFTPDPNLRLPALAPQPLVAVPESLLAPACRAELAFDRRGFLAYAPFLYLNNHRLDGDVVWARDHHSRNTPLFERYRGRRFYRYAPVEPGGTPTFVQLDSPGDAR